MSQYDKYLLHSNTLEERDILFIQSIAKKIYNSGLVTPAVLFLEMSKPLSLIGSHTLIFFGPILNAFIQSEDYYRAAQVFEDSNTVDILLQMIEEMEINSKKITGNINE